MSNSPLTLDIIEQAVKNPAAAAFRCITDYQPAGGEGDKVFPPTYEGGQYAEERRRIAGEPEPVECVLLDSVQSQANRAELALQEAWESKRLSLPVITVDFAGNDLPKVLRITSLEAPHRIADALLRDSLLDGKRFRESKIGGALDRVDSSNATALFQYCPTALVFGMWDSTGPKGGLGAKFQRAFVSEIYGEFAQQGVKTSSRLDPAQIALAAGPLYLGNDGFWTLDEKQARSDKKGPSKLGKDGKPSEANHGNVTPGITKGGYTIRKAVQRTVLSLASIRRLKFPLGEKRSREVDDAARVVLAALGLSAAALLRESGGDLRSRCHLYPMAASHWELLADPNQAPARFDLDADTALKNLKQAIEKAAALGLPWQTEEVVLQPSPQLVELVRRSQVSALAVAGE